MSEHCRTSQTDLQEPSRHHMQGPFRAYCASSMMTTAPFSVTSMVPRILGDRRYVYGHRMMSASATAARDEKYAQPATGRKVMPDKCGLCTVSTWIL